MTVANGEKTDPSCTSWVTVLQSILMHVYENKFQMKKNNSE